MPTINQYEEAFRDRLTDRQDHWAAALACAEAYVAAFPAHAPAWFALHLACRLQCKTARANEALARIEAGIAAGDEGFTNELLGDIKRDVALALIRTSGRRALDEAEQLVREIEVLHSNDQNRLNCLLMVLGRLYLAKAMLYLWQLSPRTARHYFEMAEGCYADAEVAWADMAKAGHDVNRQWRFNNTWHRFLCLVMIEGQHGRRAKRFATVASQLRGDIHGRCSSPNHRRRYQAIRIGGRAAVVADYAAIVFRTARR